MIHTDLPFTIFLTIAYGSILVWLFYVPSESAQAEQAPVAPQAVEPAAKPVLTIVPDLPQIEAAEENVFIGPGRPVWEGMKATELRDECKRLEIKSRVTDADTGRRRPMRKAEMLAALLAQHQQQQAA